MYNSVNSLSCLLKTYTHTCGITAIVFVRNLLQRLVFFLLAPLCKYFVSDLITNTCGHVCRYR